ncbi:hypothetical protein GLU60_02715 [Nanohaloarchaea archaeon H01]|nr:hypothetical protein [Nanohaloarchaea archaeon H01]
MNQGILIVGAILLVGGIFGYTYSESQQGLLQQGEDIVRGEQQNWNMIQSFSAAEIVGGIILVIAGLLPENWRDPAS